MKFAGIFREKGTLAIHLYSRKRKIMNSYFIQVSSKDMWMWPRKEHRFNNGSWLCGWLVFYFGKIKAIKAHS